MNPRLEIIERRPASPANPLKTPILFIHGMWHGAWCWEDYFLPYFAQHNYPSFAVSLRGHGQSEGRKRLRWTSLANYVADIAAVVEQLETPPVLIGHSMGGMIVQKYLKKHRVPAAVLLASSPVGGLLPTTFRVALNRPLSFLRVNLTMSLYPVISTAEHSNAFLFSGRLDEETSTKYHAKMQDESFRAYLDMLIPNSVGKNEKDTPMLNLGGEKDAVITSREITATARAFGADVEILQDISHDMMLDPGWKLVADRILQWLDDIGV